MVEPRAVDDAATTPLWRWPLPRKTPEQPLLVGYHAGCPDGALAATLIRNAARRDGIRIEFSALQAGSAPTLARASGRDVLLVDLCPRMDAMAALVENAASVVVLDHHEGSREVAERWPGHVLLAEGRCGAWLAWELINGEAEPPPFVALINDIDHYRVSDPLTAALAVLVRDANTPQKVRALWGRFESTHAAVVAEAELAAAAWRARVERYADACTAAFMGDQPIHVVELRGPDGPLASDVGNAIAARFGGIAVVFRRAGTTLRYSLRSEPGVGPPVHTLAAKYAGGGHRHAAGLISDKPLHRPQRVATDADDAGC